MSLGPSPSSCSCGGKNPNCFRCWGTGMIEPANSASDGKYLAERSYGPSPCSCGGENPNCFKCWGTGLIEPSNSTSDGKYLAERSYGKGYLSSCCPECGKDVKDFPLHWRNEHGQKSEILKKSNGGVKNKSRLIVVDDSILYTCKVCGVKVKNLTRHFVRTGHSAGAIRSGGENARQRGKSPTSGPLQLKCPKCIAVFPNETQLASHVVGSHGRKAFAEMKLNQSKNSSQGSGGRANRLDLNSQDVVETVPQVDAKRHWGNSFRDNGQFGSFPLHDDMDDESSA